MAGLFVWVFVFVFANGDVPSASESVELLYLLTYLLTYGVLIGKRERDRWKKHEERKEGTGTGI